MFVYSALYICKQLVVLFISVLQFALLVEGKNKIGKFITFKSTSILVLDYIHMLNF